MSLETPSAADGTEDLVFNADAAGPSGVSVQVKDVETGQSENYSGDVIKPAVAVAAIVGIPLLVEVLGALAVAGLVLFVAAVMFVAASEAVAKIASQNVYQHYMATTGPNDLFIGPAISYQDAIQRARVGGDVWSQTMDGARSIAFSVWNSVPVGPEIDGAGSPKYMHFHPANRRPNSHLFYGLAGR
jgi:hypothetical protein